VKVILQQYLHTRHPAEPGRWCMRAERELPAIPRQSDWVELADGWVSAPVKGTTFMANGEVIVTLERTTTDSSEIVRGRHRLVDESDWEWLGEQPARSIDSL
jgi:hypothetical protein